MQRRKSVFTELFHACLGAPGGVYLCQREPVNSLWLARLLQASPQHMAEPSSSRSVLYLWMGEDVHDSLVPEMGARRQVKSVLAFLSFGTGYSEMSVSGVSRVQAPGGKRGAGLLLYGKLLIRKCLGLL